MDFPLIYGFSEAFHEITAAMLEGTLDWMPNCSPIHLWPGLVFNLTTLFTTPDLRRPGFFH